MDQLFWIKVGMSFALGSGWVVMVTVLADRWGSKVGGLLTGLPSTMAFSLLFIALTQGALAATQATTIEPIVWGISNLLVVVYVFLARKNFWLALTCGFGIWFVLTIGLVLIRFNSYPASLIAYLTTLVFAYWVTEKVLKVKSFSGEKVKYTPAIIVSRGMLSGLVVATAVVLGKVGGPIWGGAFSMFPAMVTSTLLITYFSHGVNFSVATTKSALYGSITLIVYSFTARHTYLTSGVWVGTVAAAVISLASGYLIYRFLMKRLL